jgi:HAD superfamily 5'-nucleotidase-like hydrolase
MIEQAASLEPTGQPAPELRIYVNRNLRMGTIRAIGFDMDYTLARYHRERMEEAAHRLTLEKLVARGYPAELRALRYDPSFVIRGLTVDKQNGNILKLDRHNHACRVFHGRRRLVSDERREIYQRERISFTPPRFALIDTLFSLPEMCLFADLVDMLERPGSGMPTADLGRIFDDTRECIDEAHRDDTLKSLIKADLPHYVDRDPLLGRTLHKLRSAGKKLFLLTNSFSDYTRAVMSYLLDGDLPEYPEWQRYFDIVIVGAKKPDFFVSQTPFVELDEAGQALEGPVEKLEKGHVYQGGNLRELERLGGAGGEEILYVGDHIYGDILRSKKASLWRTALVVEELEDEIAKTRSHATEFDRLVALEEERRRLDDLTNLQRQQLGVFEKTHGSDEARTLPEFIHLKTARDEAKRNLLRVGETIDRLEGQLDAVFNPNWGMVFKEGPENSRFGAQVEDYACLYTSRVSNFLGYSAYQYFRSPRDLMAHERDRVRPCAEEVEVTPELRRVAEG